jgi:ADP-ribose pyrophosphatase
MPFETESSHQIFQGKVFDVRQDQVRMPDGKLVRLDVVDHSNSVTLIPLDEQGTIWFVHQYRHPAGQELFELPAGVCEKGEQAEVAARREIREEIGMAAGNLELLGEFYLAPGYSTEYMYVFLATDLQEDPLPGDEDEDIQVEKLDIAEALRRAETGELYDAKSIAALFLARTRLEESKDLGE